MIGSFGDRRTSDLFNGVPGRHVRSLPSRVQRKAIYKLDILNAASSLDDLRSSPGNRLEALKGGLSGYYSVRINVQWRIVFRWSEGVAYDVRIMDYH